MLLIDNTSTNPYFNIAAEEFLLKKTDEDIFMLYVDEPSVIVGKHQNTLAEINYRYSRENNIAVVRRISGGGTVYHDSGNLNFTFIANGKEGHLVDFKRFTQPIIDVLLEMGIEAKLEGKNDIRVRELKVSGNAEHVLKNRVLHHGTLLILSDVSNLSSALKVTEGKYTDNAVKSIRSKVANINNFSNEFVTVCQMQNRIFDKVRKQHDCKTYNFTQEDIEKIEALSNEKFKTWEWNYGYSPKYIFENDLTIDNKTFKITLEVENGIIIKASSESNTFDISKLANQSHEANSIRKIFHSQGLPDELVWSFF